MTAPLALVPGIRLGRHAGWPEALGLDRGLAQLAGLLALATGGAICVPAGTAPAPHSAPRWRIRAIAAALMSLILANVAGFVINRHSSGCEYYRPVAGQMLIAHAGGGMPDRMYPNSIEALDRSYARGLRNFEMDFHQLPFGLIRSGHDTSDLFDPRGAWISQVFDWLRRHPDAQLIVDMKTDNVSALRRIAAEAPDLRSRIVPYVYGEREHRAVRSLGLAKPIYATFGGNQDRDWVRVANSHDFAAVAISGDRLPMISQIKHPVILFTLDKMVQAPGVSGIITNCLMPARPR